MFSQDADNVPKSYHNGYTPKISRHVSFPAVSADWFTEFGSGPCLSPRFTTIISGFDHFATLNPDAVAIEHGNRKISYRTLDRAAARLATVMLENGVKYKDSVGLYLTRSIHMVVGILASMKVGAKYVPQHAGIAKNSTLAHISKVSNIRIILTTEDCKDKFEIAANQSLISIDAALDDESIPRHVGVSPIKPMDICMLLFTSGTTGTPNGVQVTHRNLCNILQTSPGDLGMRPGTRVGQILSISFDMAAWETLGALSNGATLVIRGSDIQETAQSVDILIATPSILNSLDPNLCQKVATVAVAGEPCPRQLADKWSSFCNFYNSCGPTETTIINTAALHTPEKDQLTIGRPTPNNTVYILDENMRPVGLGESGVMWAGGDCVTDGYLANPELNTERYRPDPFRPGYMMFNTRDLGAWTRSGELLHFGRVDDMVKIRGFRVELDGISRLLERTDGCERALTLKYDDKTLVAFVSPASVCPTEAKKNIEKELPYYCSPKVVIPLDAFPVTPRGKIDKKALLARAERAFAALPTETRNEW